MFLTIYKYSTCQVSGCIEPVRMAKSVHVTHKRPSNYEQSFSFQQYMRQTKHLPPSATACTAPSMKGTAEP